MALSRFLYSSLLFLPMIATAAVTDSAHGGPHTESACRYPANENLGWEFYRANDFSQALTVFQNTLSVTPDDISALRGQAYSLYKLKQYPLAILKLPQIANLEATHNVPAFEETTKNGQVIAYNAASLNGWTLYAIGKPHQAKSQFNAVLDRHPRWADSYTGLGYTAILINRRAMAESAFKRALAVTPHYQPALRGLKEAKKMRYGLNFAYYTKYGNDGIHSPYESSSSHTARIGYDGFHDKFNAQATHASYDTIALGQNSSTDRFTASWAHLADQGLTKRLGFRIDIAQISHSKELYDKTVIPYASLLYFDRNHGQYYDVGMSRSHYKSAGYGADIRIDQFSATAGRSFGKRRFWAAFRVMDQILSHPESTETMEHLLSGSAMLKWRAKPHVVDVSAFAMGGEQKLAYSPHMLNVALRTERHINTLGLSTGWHCCKNGLLSLIMKQERYNPETKRRFAVTWLGLGFNYHV